MSGQHDTTANVCALRPVGPAEDPRLLAGAPRRDHR